MNKEGLLSKLTIKEKIKLLNGNKYWESTKIERLGINNIFFSDGPNGLRRQGNSSDNFGFNKSFPATCFPTACLSSCSFDKNLIYEMGVALARECKDQGVDIILGPGVNIKRSPLCGRNFEYFSEDPFLAGTLAKSYINGVQSLGIGCSLKHFALNNQEKNRLIGNSIADLRTIHEIYLEPFRIAVESKPYTIMASYNQIDGVYACENKWLLKDTLRTDWGYDGAVITDWGAINNPVLSYKNGLNLEMPGLDKSRLNEIYKAYKKGLINETEINNAVKDVLKLIDKVNLGRQIKSDCSYEDNLKLALKIASESIVLAKNDDSILPLKKEKIGVIGLFAKEPRYQGEGSSNINPTKVDSFIEELSENQIEYDYESDYDKIENCKKIARDNKIIIYFIGVPSNYESEGFDRDIKELPANQINLLTSILEINSNVVVVYQGGSSIDLRKASKGKALLLEYLGGAKSGEALYQIIFGIINPSGHLSETIPLTLDDCPVNNYPDSSINVKYEEGQYVGYRYYDYYNIDVLYPFGHGLSYTEFNFSNFKQTETSIEFTIKNIGKYEGKEVIQLYVSLTKENKLYKSLKYFEKIYLRKDESKTIIIPIEDSFFSFYSVDKKRFVKGSGTYLIQIGTSSRDIKFEARKEIIGEETNNLPKYGLEFSSLPKTNDKKGHYTINSTTIDLKSCRLGRILNKIINKKTRKMIKKDPNMERIVTQMIGEAPLRILLIASDGFFTYKKIQGLVDLLNGHFFKGISKMLF